MYWINPDNHEFIRQTSLPVRNGTDSYIDSYMGHSFIVVVSGETPKMNSNQPTFTLGTLDTVVTVTTNPENQLMTLVLITEKTQLEDKMAEILDYCRQEAIERFPEPRQGMEVNAGGEVVNNRRGVLLSRANAAQHCIKVLMSEELVEVKREESFMKELQLAMANRLRDYQCADPTAETSQAVSRSYWRHAVIKDSKGTMKPKGWGGRRRGFDGVHVDTLLDQERAKMQLVHDWISEEECQYFIDQAKPKLHKATVAGRTLQAQDPGRRAMQAGILYDWDDPENPATRVANRTFAFASDALGIEFPLRYQEQFTVIQYGVDDEYRPHCDAGCTGEEYLPGGRVATMVMYCQTATKGGGTTFTNANIFVQPQPGQASFFSYLGPPADGNSSSVKENRIMDDGLTEHSGCPIYEGEKWIVTLWMRLGVSEGHSADMVDPRGFLAK